MVTEDSPDFAEGCGFGHMESYTYNYALDNRMFPSSCRLSLEKASSFTMAPSAVSATAETAPTEGADVGPLYQERRMKIICVGAGASGLCLAYKLQRSFENFELVVYEKNKEVSGTWYENRYPG